MRRAIPLLLTAAAAVAIVLLCGCQTEQPPAPLLELDRIVNHTPAEVAALLGSPTEQGRPDSKGWWHARYEREGCAIETNYAPGEDGKDRCAYLEAWLPGKLARSREQAVQRLGFFPDAKPDRCSRPTSNDIRWTGEVCDWENIGFSGLRSKVRVCDFTGQTGSNYAWEVIVYPDLAAFPEPKPPQGATGQHPASPGAFDRDNGSGPTGHEPHRKDGS